MTEVGPSAREALPTIEQVQPSPALVLRLAYGEFDPNKPIAKDSQKKPFTDALHALNEHNMTIRKSDEAKFAEKYKDRNLSDADIRHNYMAFWALGASFEIGHDLNLEGRADKTALILRDKLGIPLTGNGEQDSIIIGRQFYDIEEKTEGEFYKKFCTNTMNEKLAQALTVDDMMHLKTFLTKWMLGSDEAFTALVTLRHSIDMVSDETKRASLTSHYNDKLSDRDSRILAFFRGETEEEKKKSKEKAEESQEREEQSPLVMRAASKTETDPRHPDVNQDESFFDEKNLRAGIFDGAGGHYRGDLASKEAKEAVMATLKELTADASFEDVQKKIQDAMEAANQRVRQIETPAGERPSLTTGTIYQVWQGPNGERKLAYASVGDSRLWVRRQNGEITYLTHDDNMLKGRLRGGVISREEYDAIQAHIDDADTKEKADALGDNWNQSRVTAMLGQEDAYCEPGTIDLAPGDTVFLTSDGVHDNLTRTEIEAIARSTTDPTELSDLLVSRAKEVADTYGLQDQSGAKLHFRAKQDDITALAAQFS